jgi:dihydroorotate dehydrogenase electron transfer subunit
VRARVAFNRPISTAYLHLGLAAPGFPPTFRAGEFVMVRPTGVGDPFLPRAFSIYRVSGGADSPAVVEILYKVLGKGTRYLARLDVGQEIEILGPFGNAFTLPEDLGHAVLVAGGIGVPPIAALAVELAKMRNTQRVPEWGMRNMEVFLGGKTSEDILCVKDFEEAGARVHITTEDGSLGTRGLVTDLLGPFLRGGTQALRHPGTQASPECQSAQVPTCRLYTCGPPGMLAAVARLAEELAVPCQVSVEANMACGFGACMGCAVEIRADVAGPGYKLVCKDGPVFDSREIVWR